MAFWRLKVLELGKARMAIDIKPSGKKLVERRREQEERKKEEMIPIIEEPPKPVRKKIEIIPTDNHVDPLTAGAPLDYSFRKAENLSQLENGIPREFRVGIPKKGTSDKYVSSSLWANYNNLTNLETIDSLVNVSFERPDCIYWLDVSFNQIQNISNELLGLNNLKILYLHGNRIQFLIEVGKLKNLKYLKTLTLHGNPVENIPNYRLHVIKLIPQLTNLDFSVITKDEKIAAKSFKLR